MATTVVNLRIGERGDVYIGRGAGGRVASRPGERGYFGNPLPMASEADRESVVAEYGRYFEERIAKDLTFRAEVLKLKGKRLSCWCAPRACHGDVIAAWVDAQD